MNYPEARGGDRAVVEATGAVRRLRTALLDMISETGADALQPQEVSRRFGLDKTLTWKIARVVRDDNIHSSISHVPGRKRIASLLAAMEKGGASAASIEATRQAYAEFERIVEVHSGDRGALDVIMASGERRPPGARIESFRRASFQSNAAVWGVRAKAHLGWNLMAPGEGDMLDAVSICAMTSLERLRPALPWAIANATVFDGPERDVQGPTALYEGGFVNGGPLLPQFSSSPLPRLRTITQETANRRIELLPGELGQSGAVNVVLGWRWPRNLSMRASRPDEIGEHGLNISTPVEAAIIELWVHRDLEFATDVRSCLYSALPSGPKYPTEGRQAGLLQFPSEVVSLGSGEAAAAMPEFPGAGELMGYAAGRLGRSLDEFVGFRWRLRYPPIPTLALLQHPLAPPVG